MDIVADRIGEFEVSALTDDDARLRARLSEEGYLFFRGFFPRETIREVRLSLCPALFAMGLVEAPTGEPRWTGSSGAHLDDAPLYATTRYASLFESDLIATLLERLLGEPAFIFKCPGLNYVTPDDGKYATVTHQDGYFTAPDPEFLQMWVPLMDVDPVNGGGLSIAPRTHRNGPRPHHVLPQPSHLGSVTDELGQIGIPLTDVEADWLTIGYRAGDLVIFNCNTIHRALPNSSDKIRLSVNNGAQPASLPRSYYSQASILQKRALDRLWQSKADASAGGKEGMRSGAPGLAIKLINNAGLQRDSVLGMTRFELVEAWNDFLFGPEAVRESNQPSRRAD